MAESVTPGSNGPKRGGLNDPARAIGNHGREIDAMSRRLQSLERFLSPYREIFAQVRQSDGTFKTIAVLAKEGGGASAGGFGTTIQPKEFKKVGSGWVMTFHPAKFMEHSLKNPGKAHEITCSGGSLDSDPSPEISISDGDDVWLAFTIDPDGSVSDGSTRIVVGQKPEESKWEPKRPTGGGTAGKHVNHVGKIRFTDDSPEWVPVNSDATVSNFCPEIKESGGDEDQGIFNNWGDGIDTFKKLKQLFTNGFKIIKPPSDEGGETIDFKELKNSYGESGTGSVYGLIHRESDTSILFRGIGAVEDEPQVQVEVQDEGRKIVVKGNGTTEDFEGYRCVGINVKDGLVTGASFEGDDAPEDDAWAGTITWRFTQVGATYFDFLRITVAGGKITAVGSGISSSGGEEATDPIATGGAASHNTNAGSL